MKFEELLEKYQALLIENDNLKREIKALKAQLGLEESQAAYDENFWPKSEDRLEISRIGIRLLC